jgi:hypothetical protein
MSERRHRCGQSCDTSAPLLSRLTPCSRRNCSAPVNPAPDPGPRADAGPVLPVRPRLPAEQTSDSPGGGPYELTGQLPDLPHSPVAGSRLG